MEEKFICKRCGNSDPKYIGYIYGKPYCRFCIGFHGEEVKRTYPIYIKDKEEVTPKLYYELSEKQVEISNRVIYNFKNKTNTLIHAVCGAGKTELVYGVISYVLTKGGKVGFAIPRKDVVIELTSRIKDTFPELKVASVYGGHSNILEGDIIVLTTHQLYRYEKYFDLLILDEIDAFPYNGDLLLEKMFFRSLRGRYVWMSATPSQEVINRFSKKGHEILTLDYRYHLHPLPEPKVVVKYLCMKHFYLVKKLKEYQKRRKPCFIFAPTIDQSSALYSFLKPLFKSINYVNSKRKNREKIIEDFKKGKINFLVTTAVLERGVTIKDLQVIIFNADSELYDEHSLVQIAGRAGRKKDAPEGEVIFIIEKENDKIRNAIKEIKRSNKELQNMLQTNQNLNISPLIFQKHRDMQ